MSSVLKNIWQLPQTLLGKLLLLVYRPKKTLLYKGKTVHCDCNISGAISLGNVIICKVYPNDKHRWDTVKHEYGHTFQSQTLGWFYLPTVGLLSILGCVYARLLKKSDKWYYSLPWEKYADRKGDVVRSY